LCFSNPTILFQNQIQIEDDANAERLLMTKKKTIANIMLWWIIRECSCN